MYVFGTWIGNSCSAYQNNDEIPLCVIMLIEDPLLLFGLSGHSARYRLIILVCAYNNVVIIITNVGYNQQV